MSFSFLSITLKNWLVYEKEVKIDFGRPVDGRNIHIIYGMNGFGKTSLLRAIQWGFHNSLPDKSIKDCFNTTQIASGNNELSVTIEFLYNNSNYRLTRRAFARLNALGNVVGVSRQDLELAIDNQLKKGAIEETIAQILPAECQQFFFFDGLEIEKYARRSNDKDTLDAVERVLGIPEVRNLENDLKKLETDLKKERDQLLKDKHEYNQLGSQRNEAELNLEATKETLANLKEKQHHLESLIEGLEARANQLSAIQEKQLRHKELTRNKREISERLANYVGELQRKLNIVTRRMTLDLLKQRQVSLSTELTKADKASSRLGQATAKEKLLEELLRDANCICGEEINTQMRSHLEKQLKEIKTEAEAAKQLQGKVGSLRQANEELSKVRFLIEGIEQEETPEVIARTLALKFKLQVDLEEIDLELAGLEKELQEHGDADVRQVYQTLAEKQNEKTSLISQIKKAEEDVKEAQSQLDKIQTELNRAALKVPGESRLIATLEQSMLCRNVSAELVMKLVELRRSSIERHLTEVFRSITNKKKEYDRIELGNDYAPRVRTNSGKYVENDQLSAGEKEVLAFSFIAGLNLSIEAGAPLVMDTPFGHLDAKHRQGLIDALPNLPCQVILLATDRDIPFGELDKLRPNLGGQFSIERDEIEEFSYVEKVI